MGMGDRDYTLNTLRIKTTLNGLPRVDTIEPRMLLADYLREHVGLKGTKVSCDTQICGTCTILLEGKPVSSCTTLAAEADGRSVETIEGLAPPNGLHPIQEAFVQYSALQCGYCTPGMIMTAYALLSNQSDISEAAIRHYFQGNICRCGTYGAIIEAILSVRPSQGDSGKSSE